MCLTALSGVGDATRGAIADERMRLSYNVRRRLSVKEEESVGGACDIRGLTEAQERYERASFWLPKQMLVMAQQEMAS